MRLLHARTRAFRVAPKARARFAVRGANVDPAGDRAFSHVFREGAAGSRFAAGGQVRDTIADEDQADERQQRQARAPVRRPAASSARSPTTSYDKDVILWSRAAGAALARRPVRRTRHRTSGGRDRRRGQKRKARTGKSYGCAAGSSSEMEPPAGESRATAGARRSSIQRKRDRARRSRRRRA